jgi:hypothetical protein
MWSGGGAIGEVLISDIVKYNAREHKTGNKRFSGAHRLRLKELLQGYTDSTPELNHCIDANIVHRVLDFRNVSLRDTGFLRQLALTKAGGNAGRPQISRENLPLDLAFGLPSLMLGR